MYSNYETENLINQFNQKVKGKSQKLRNYLLISIINLLVILFLIIYLTRNNTDAIILISIFAGLILIGLFLVLFFSKIIPSNTETYNFLYPQIYEKINEDLELDLQYQTKNKVDNNFIRAGGIFSKHVRVQVYRNISGKTENNNEFKVFDCALITGGGQYQQIHLNGIYLFTKVNTDSVIQIRSNGKPQTKEYNFKKLEEVTDFKVFIETTKNFSSTDKLLLQKARELKTKLNAKHLYLSVNNGVLHLAYYAKTNPRMQRNLHSGKINQIYQRFNLELQIVDELVNIFNF